MWLWRQETHASWADAEATPRWRIERDLAYLGLRNRAQTWHTQEAARAADAQRRKEQVRSRWKGEG